MFDHFKWLNALQNSIPKPPSFGAIDSILDSPLVQLQKKLNTQFNSPGLQLQKGLSEALTPKDFLGAAIKDKILHMAERNYLETNSAIGIQTLLGTRLKTSSYIKLAQQFEQSPVFESNVLSIANSLSRLSLNNIVKTSVPAEVLVSSISKITAHYFQQFVEEEDYEDVEVINEITESAVASLSETNDPSAFISFLKSLIEEIKLSYKDASNLKKISYLFIAISIYANYLQIFDDTNEKILQSVKTLEENQKEIIQNDEHDRKESKENFDSLFHALQKIKEMVEEKHGLNDGKLDQMLKDEKSEIFSDRESTTHVVLRASAKKKSRQLGVVKKGQTVLVIKIQKKWLLVQYEQIDTGEPKSGWVFKKYFKQIN